MSQDTPWFVGIAGQQQGPMPTGQLVHLLQTGQIPDSAYAFTQGMATWAPVRNIPQLAHAFGMQAPPMPPPMAPANTSDVIDYEIKGDDLQYVEVTLDPGEAVIAESGAMLYLETDIGMRQLFGDGTERQQSALEVAMAAGQRLLTGESLTFTEYRNNGQTRRTLAFAAPYPGRIIPMDLKQLGGEVLCEKSAFLGAAKGTTVSIAFQRKILVGLFGGEGFVLQRIKGDGIAFLHAGGAIFSRTLAAGETLRIDTGCLMAFQPSVNYDVQMVEGISNMLFGGEGLFVTTLTGPGIAWIQSLPFSRMAGRIHAAAPQTGGTRVGEGSILGGIGDVAMGGLGGPGGGNGLPAVGNLVGAVLRNMR
jgi:uncharacterized protein (TIGR00266 family)